MELPLLGVGELPTSAAQEIYNSHDATHENDFDCGAEFDPSLGVGNPIMDWYGLFNGSVGLANTTMGGNQHFPTAQSGLVTMDSFDHLTSAVHDVYAPAWFPVDLPVNQPIYSDQSSPPSYEQLANASIYQESNVMENTADLPPSSIYRYQNALWPTGQEFNSTSDFINSNAHQNIFDNNGLCTLTHTDIAPSEPYTRSESSAETYSPIRSSPLCSKSASQQHSKRRQSSALGSEPQTSAAVKRRKDSKATLVSIGCMACKALRIRCEGPPLCNRCQVKCMPLGMYTTSNLWEVINFDKWLREEYELKRVYRPSHYERPTRVAYLQHYVNGPVLPVKCYYFEPDPKQPSQTEIYWKDPGWKSAKTTPVSLSHLKYDLEPYVEKLVDIILDKASEGPHYIAELFRLAQKFNAKAKKPVINLGFKMYVAGQLLKGGWSISDSDEFPKESLGNHVLYAERSPWHGKTPAPSTMQRQLDHMLEGLVAKWEVLFCKDWQKIKRNQGKNGWIEMFFASFLILHIVEQDAQRLKIHCEELSTINDWKHPMKPRALVEKAMHFCNTFLAHFRGVSGKLHPLRLEWLPEDTKSLAKGNEVIVEVIDGLKEHKRYLEKNKLINRKPCDTYKPGDDDSFNFTWSSCLFDDNGITIRMRDYLGKYN